MTEHQKLEMIEKMIATYYGGCYLEGDKDENLGALQMLNDLIAMILDYQEYAAE